MMRWVGGLWQDQNARRGSLAISPHESGRISVLDFACDALGGADLVPISRVCPRARQGARPIAVDFAAGSGLLVRTFVALDVCTAPLVLVGETSSVFRPFDPEEVHASVRLDAFRFCFVYQRSF
jgi:hypothetical protein